MCCTGAKWKREQVPDHKFDYIDTRDYNSKAFSIRLQYVWVYILVLKSFAVYIADIYTATTMLTSDKWASKVFDSCKENDGCVPISFEVGKWLFVSCILLSFLLLGYEIYKSKKIIRSRDISFAFTNLYAQRYYALRSYDHFCFFCHIEDSTKKKDDFAFFIFFTFKTWKRTLLCDGPRQTINALTLYSFYLAKKTEKGEWYALDKYFDPKDMVTNIFLVTITFTVLIFAGSLLLLIVAGICYIPLLCYIQGNLKEYCCHKVDKRIAELIKRKQKQRVARVQQLAKKEAAGDFSHRKDKDGNIKMGPQPTLPKIHLDDDDDISTIKGGKPGYASSVRTGKESYWGSDYNDKQYGAYDADYPPMPAYDPAAFPPQPGYTNGNYASSVHDDATTLQDHDNKNYAYGQYDQYGADPYGRAANNYSADPYGRAANNNSVDPYGRAANNNSTVYGAQADYHMNGFGNDPNHHGGGYDQYDPQYQQADQGQNHQRGYSKGGAGGYAY